MANEGSQQSIKGTITVSSGSGSLTLTPIWLSARWVRVAPVSETDTYDLTILDGDGLIMVKRTSQLGTFSERLEMSLGIMKTVQIASATQDGSYSVRFDPH